MGHDHHPSGIHRLSPEVLLQVFALVTQDNAYGYASEQQWWDVICQTCSSWRILALSAPTLWTHIVDAPSPWTQILIQRSQSLPLEVAFTILNPYHWESCALVIEQSHRIRSLSIHFRLGQSWKYMRLLANAINQPLPWLEHCHIDDRITGYRSSTISISLDAPRLTNLYLQNLDLVPPPQALMLLRRFSHFSSSLLSDTSRLLAAVAAMPMLQSLDLQTLGFTNYQGRTESIPVRLERLSKIRLQGLFGWVLYFLSLFAFPIAADLDIVANYRLDREAVLFDQFHQSLLPRLEFVTQKKETFLIFNRDSCLTIQLAVKTVVGLKNIFSLRFDGATERTWEELPNTPNFNAFMKSLSELTAVKLWIVSANFKELIKSIYDVVLRHFTHIQELHLEMSRPTIGARKSNADYPLSSIMKDFTAVPGWYDGKVLPSIKRLVLWTSNPDKDLLSSTLRTFTGRNLERIDIPCEHSLPEEWKQRLASACTSEVNCSPQCQDLVLRRWV